MSIETTVGTDRTGRENTGATSNIRDVGSLLSQLGHDVNGLVTTEMSLAKAEIGESLDDAKNGAMRLATGAVILFAGLMVLLYGLARTLATLTDVQVWPIR